jgi:hypothetical protein
MLGLHGSLAHGATLQDHCRQKELSRSVFVVEDTLRDPDFVIGEIPTKCWS